MANSLLSSIFDRLDPQTVDRIAVGLGAPGQLVSQGLRTSIATVLGSLASRSGDSHALRGMLDLIPAGLADTTLSDVARAATEPDSSLISGGKQILSGLFGQSQTAITEGLSSSTGLRPGAASTLLSIAAPIVFSFIIKRVRASALSMTGLGDLLANETNAIRNVLPTGIAKLIWPGGVDIASPVIAQSVQTESSSLRWLLPLLALAVVIPSIFWLANRTPNVTRPQISGITPPSRSFGTANRLAPDANRVVNTSNDLVKGVLSGALLRFDTGSSKLTPASEAKLDQVASTLAAYPDVRVTINGHTDNVGSADSNKTLSKQRANSVMAELVHKGISVDRLTAKGYGQDDPVADNSTADGRAQNRRVTVNVKQQ